MPRIAIIGAGISGLTLAKKLIEKGIQPTVYEKCNSIGGLCQTRIVEGFTFDISGGHVFNSKHNDVKKWVFDMMGQESWQYSKRKAKILYNNALIDYPFELSLSQLNEIEQIECLVDFFAKKDIVPPHDFYDWLIWAFGDSIARKYMIPYNEKIWEYDLHLMSTDWVNGKMPIPSIKNIVESVVKQGGNETIMPHSNYYYPKKGGIKTLVGLIADNVNDIRTNEPVISIENYNRKYIINGQDVFDIVINTAPLPELVGKISCMPKQVSDALCALKYTSIKTILFECSRENDFSWVYLPNKAVKPHRIVYQGNFSLYNTPESTTSSLTVETCGNCPTELILDDFVKYYNVGQPLAEHVTEYAYVLYDLKRAKNMKIVTSYFQEYGLALLGRFAEWEYLNMDICMKKAFDVAEKITLRF